MVQCEKADLAGCRLGCLLGGTRAPAVCCVFLYWKVGCGFLFGGLVSAMRYASEVRGDWCHRSAHWSMAVLSALSFWFLMVRGSRISFMLAMRMASIASCLALLKPTNKIPLGSDSSLMFREG